MIEFLAGIAIGAGSVIALAFAPRRKRTAPPAPTTPTRAQLENAISVARTYFATIQKREGFEPMSGKLARSGMARMERALSAPTPAHTNTDTMEAV
ncbi:hypothetical protein [Leisingera sp. M523]|uniref:hypothetical protein n=1 Tax=Leisingera sp. M523 TaxID=2867013 RepID=UPI0021A3073B|nr:hypothetical protein [Leisingera sp. M523]UWQ30210.1 hypothetical protein K3557_06650 [Leisingera sp. M523]